MLELSKDDPLLRQGMEDQIGRAIKPADRIPVIEALRIYDWHLDPDRPVI